MTTLDQMWEKFEAHQPVADRLGYGEAWRRMCEERTVEAADAAADAAWEVEDPADVAAAAAETAAAAVRSAAVAKRWAERAIEFIEQAEGAA